MAAGLAAAIFFEIYKPFYQNYLLLLFIK